MSIRFEIRGIIDGEERRMGYVYLPIVPVESSTSTLQPSIGYDLNLTENSIAIDAGNPNYTDPDGTISDIGAIYFNQTNQNDCTINYDANNDGELNVLDIVAVVNLILYGQELDCNIDYDGDFEINILDIIIMINLILEI